MFEKGLVRTSVNPKVANVTVYKKEVQQVFFTYPLEKSTCTLIAFSNLTTASEQWTIILQIYTKDGKSEIYKSPFVDHI